MIRLFKVKEKQRELAENANGGPPLKKQTAGELRLHKGLSLIFIDRIFSAFPYSVNGLFESLR
uniref:NEDD8-conjugating enzyme Ubc12 n=1 Tax=Rhizophora mucronata TaxID=61149 RepID=A0A2P2KKS5_RHIMU